MLCSFVRVSFSFCVDLDGVAYQVPPIRVCLAPASPLPSTHKMLSQCVMCISNTSLSLCIRGVLFKLHRELLRAILRDGPFAIPSRSGDAAGGDSIYLRRS